MKRHPALYPLSHDHHQGLILAQQLKKGAPQYKGMPSNLEDKKKYTIAFYNSELINHFLEEEEILFPLVKGRNSDVDNQMKVIIKEHKMMEKLISEIKDTNELEEKLDELGWLLEKHIRKEERELFTAIEKLLTENELSKLESKLKQ